MSPTNLRSPVWLRLRGALWVPAYLAVFALLEHLPRQHYWATQLPLDAGMTDEEAKARLEELVRSLWDNTHPKVHIDRPYV